MMKKVLIGVVALIIVVGLGLGYLWSNLDSIIRAAIEKYGTAATQTEVALDSVKLSLSSGEGALHGLSVDNPKDFSSGVKALYLGSIDVKVDANSIKGNGPIVIREVTIEKPQVNYEITSSGTSNLSVLQHNAVDYANAMNASSGGANASPSPKATSASSDSKDSGGGRKIIIGDLYVRDGQIGISTQMLKDKNITAPLPVIHLSNIGKNSGGATAADVIQQLLSSITASAGSVATGTIAKNLGGLMDNNAVKTLGGAANDSTSNVKNQIKGMFGN